MPTGTSTSVRPGDLLAIVQAGAADMIERGEIGQSFAETTCLPISHTTAQVLLDVKPNASLALDRGYVEVCGRCDPSFGELDAMVDRLSVPVPVRVRIPLAGAPARKSFHR